MSRQSSGSYTPAPARGSCPTDKVQYANRKQARAAARKIQQTELRAYPCDECDWFHLGHRPQTVRNGQLDKDTWLEANTRRRTS